MTIDYTTIQLILALFMIIALVGFYWHRIKTDKAIGVRAIQFITALIVLPTIAILGLAGDMDDATLGALFGAVIGYVLSRLPEGPN